MNAVTKASERSSSAARSAAGPSTAVPSTSRAVASIGSPASLSRQRPTRSKFSSAKPNGSMSWWHDAQTGSVRCASMRWRSVFASAGERAPDKSASTPGGGGGTSAPSRFSTIHAPRTTGDVRFATEVAVRMLPRPKSPPRGLSSRKLHAAEIAAAHARRCRSGARGARRGTCSAPSSSSSTLRSSRMHVLEQQLGLAPERAAQLRVEARVLRQRVVELAQLEPLARRSSRRAPRRAGRRACAAPAARARPARAARPRPRRRAARRRGCCSRGRTTTATRARGR